MKAFVLFFFVLGLFLIMHGMYEEKIRAIQKDKRIEYRFIPRTYLEEQLADTNVSGKMASMFTKESPWFERTVTLPKPDR
jgi:hypothetical protein